VDVVGRDRPGFLATVTKVLAAHDLDVDNAVVATWSDRAALESFQVRAEVEPDPVSIARQVEAGITADLSSPPIPEANVSFDNSLSPWHTICEVRAPDKPGLLHALASALAGAAVSVHSARITTDNGVASDRFELTDPNGRKLDAAQCDLVVALIRGGSLMRKRRLPVGFGRGKVRVVDPSLVASPEL
jgi:[protein-PII] uridylyltransferase